MVLLKEIFEYLHVMLVWKEIADHKKIKIFLACNESKGCLCGSFHQSKKRFISNSNLFYAIDRDVELHYLRSQRDAQLSSRAISETQRSTASYHSSRGPPTYQAPPPPEDRAPVRHRPPRPKTADFFVSVPIFNETMDHR